jgi:hypothetical protein
MKIFIFFIFVTTSFYSYSKVNLNDAITKANSYSWGIVGSPSRQSDAEIRLRDIFDKTSSAVLISMLNESNNQGKAYIFCALYLKDKKAYAEIVKKNMLSGNVSILRGSVKRLVSFKNILIEIEKTNCHQLKL